MPEVSGCRLVELVAIKSLKVANMYVLKIQLAFFFKWYQRSTPHVVCTV